MQSLEIPHSLCIELVIIDISPERLVCLFRELIYRGRSLLMIKITLISYIHHECNGLKRMKKWKCARDRVSIFFAHPARRKHSNIFSALCFTPGVDSRTLHESFEGTQPSKFHRCCRCSWLLCERTFNTAQTHQENYCSPVVGPP